MLNPPIARMGGKSKLRKQIINIFPKHTCYIEPFFGAGWVYFGKELSKVEIINDVDGELVNLFRMIKYHPYEFERQLQYELSSRDLFLYHQTCDISRLTEIQRAVRFYYLVSNSFASKGKHFGYGTSRPPKSSPSHEYLTQIQNRLKNTYIENLDFPIIFKKYDRTNSFFFCDPPYLDLSIDGYNCVFNETHHVQLAKILKDIQGKFLLTINEHPTILKLYKEYNITNTEVLYSVSKTKRTSHKELIITNY